MSKHLKVEIIIVSIALILLVGIIFFINKSINNSSRADVAEERLSVINESIQVKYKTDSINLYNQFKATLKLKDSSYNYSLGQLSKIKPIIKYYDAKISYIQNANNSIVDKQFDSLLTTLRKRYNK